MPKTFCPLPWTNLNSNTEGSIKLCCSILENYHVRNKDRELNFGIDDIESIWNGDYMKYHRKQFLENKKPKTCSVCWNLEEKKVYSPRQSAVKEYPNIQELINATDEQGSFYQYPTSLELRFGNHCNLQCNSCWSLSSDKIANERAKLVKTGNLSKWLSAVWEDEATMVQNANFEWFKTKAFKDTFKKLAPTLNRIYLTGGEPTLIDENVEILQTLLDANNKNCYVALTTNLTHWNEEFYKRLSYFNNAEVQISVDGIGEKNSYIRYPSKWEHIEKNFVRLRNNLPTHFIIKHYTVYSIFNYNSIKDIIDWAFADHVPPRRYIWAPIICTAPDWLDIKILPKQYREKALNNLNELDKNIYKDDRTKNAWFVGGITSAKNYLKSTLNKEGDPDTIKMFFEVMDVLDKERKVNLNTLFPELTCLRN